MAAQEVVSVVRGEGAAELCRTAWCLRTTAPHGTRELGVLTTVKKTQACPQRHFGGRVPLKFFQQGSDTAPPPGESSAPWSPLGELPPSAGGQHSLLGLEVGGHGWRGDVHRPLCLCWRFPRASVSPASGKLIDLLRTCGPQSGLWRGRAGDILCRPQSFHRWPLSPWPHGQQQLPGTGGCAPRQPWHAPGLTLDTATAWDADARTGRPPSGCPKPGLCSPHSDWASFRPDSPTPCHSQKVGVFSNSAAGIIP